MMSPIKAVIIGDSFNNTLGLVRSLGEAKIELVLILVGEQDPRFVCKSRYLNKKNTFRVHSLDQSMPILDRLAEDRCKYAIICSNDNAATFVDEHEPTLYPRFITPMSGKRLGEYMNKASQCELAVKCGFDTPQSFVYHTGETYESRFPFPILLKPLYSTAGEKSDIHICRTQQQLDEIFKADSACKEYIVQEFIEKEYELNLLGVSTDFGILVPGGVQKIRHYPTICSPCSFGLFQPTAAYGINTSAIQKFMDAIGYRGLFSIELLHKGDKNYFLEVNFRNDGLAYAATKAGVNLPAIYMSFEDFPKHPRVSNTYMMDLSTDYCHVKDEHLSRWQWMKDFCKTGCLLSFDKKDIAPTLYYYLAKTRKKDNNTMIKRQIQGGG